jgi:NADH:ubiquinone oxidoreductase subunit H
LRKGANKVRVGGILQPFNDAIKLFSKDIVVPLSADNLMYRIRPAIAIILALVVYLRFPLEETLISISLSLSFIYPILSLNNFLNLSTF